MVVMNLVNILVEGAIMKKSMDPVEIKVFYSQKHHHLPSDGPPRGNLLVISNHSHRPKAVMSEEDDGKFDYAVQKHETLEAPPLQRPVVILSRLDFVIISQEGDEVGQKKGNVNDEITEFVHQKSSQSSNNPLRVRFEKSLPSLHKPWTLHYRYNNHEQEKRSSFSVPQ